MTKVQLESLHITQWAIEARDSLVLRDSRPFDSENTIAYSLTFPHPSTMAGATRAFLGSSPQTGKFSNFDEFPNFYEMRTSLFKDVYIRGPLLVELDDNDLIQETYFPAPRDAIFFSKNKDNPLELLRYQLIPISLNQNEGTDLQYSKEENIQANGTPHLNRKALKLLGYKGEKKGKIASFSPKYWKQKEFLQWLMAPTSQQTVQLNNIGLLDFEKEWRTHVSIDSQTLAAKEGALFQVQHLRLFQNPTIKEARTSLKLKRFAFGVELEVRKKQEKWQERLRNGFVFLGGERRIAFWRKQPTKSSFYPQKPPQEIIDKILEHRACRLYLATPAFFKEGVYPRWFIEKSHNAFNVEVKIISLATHRPIVLSGWSSEKKRPKPSRRLMDSGSVFFLELKGKPENIENWLTYFWGRNISDDNEEYTEEKDYNTDKQYITEEQYRCDGYGIAFFGTLFLDSTSNKSN